MSNLICYFILVYHNVFKRLDDILVKKNNSICSFLYALWILLLVRSILDLLIKALNFLYDEYMIGYIIIFGVLVYYLIHFLELRIGFFEKKLEKCRSTFDNELLYTLFILNTLLCLGILLI